MVPINEIIASAGVRSPHLGAGASRPRNQRRLPNHDGPPAFRQPPKAPSLKPNCLINPLIPSQKSLHNSPDTDSLQRLCRPGSPRHRADQSADNRADCRRAKRDPSGVPAAMMNVVNDMMPRRRRAVRTMPPVMRRGNRRASRQNHSCCHNRNCLDDLVHVTPTFPDFCPYTRSGSPPCHF